MDQLDEARRSELRCFLKARRAAAKRPEAALGYSRRRGAGLRIEEVCAFAGVSVSWYGALEQGKPIGVSPRTLGRIANALQLDDTDRDHLFTLALAERVQTQGDDDMPVRALLDGFTAGPAMLADERLSVIAYNEAAKRLYRFNPDCSDFANSIPYRVFTDPNRLTFYENWQDHAKRVAGILRRNYAARAGDVEFDAFIALLRSASNEFTEFWERVEVRGFAPLRKELHVEPVGSFALTIVMLPVPSSRQTLLFQTPETPRDAQALHALGVTADR